MSSDELVSDSDDAGENEDVASDAELRELDSEPSIRHSSAPDRSGRRPIARPAKAPFLQRYQRPLIAALGGVVSALATPPIDLYPLMVVGMALLAYSLRDCTRFWRGFAMGAAWATAGQLIVMRFVPSVIMLFTNLGTAAALLAHVLLSAAQSLHWALGMGLAVALRRRLRAPLELTFGAGVLLALWLPNIFVWSPAGLLSPWPALVQSADLIGERGVSVLLAIIAALSVRAVRAWPRRRENRRLFLVPTTGAGLILACMLAYGGWAMQRYDDQQGSEARMALIHAGIDPKVRWQPNRAPMILSELKRQTSQAELAGVDLSVWPEAAYPYAIPHVSRRAPTGNRRIIDGSVRGPVLFGAILRDQPRKLEDGGWELDRFNSATIVSSDGKLQAPYDKMELLWFGETVPLGQYLPWLRRLFQRSGGLVPGRELRGLSLERNDGEPAVSLGVLNCYEDTLPGLGRRIAREVQPNVLVNVTNDAWFVGTNEPELHARLGAMRAIELRRDLVRAVNLGVSGWIDAAGRVRARRDDPAPGWLLVSPKLRNGSATFYARFGDAPTALLLLGGMIIARLRRRERDAE